MCLHLKSLTDNELIANSDIVCYKVLLRDTGTGERYTPYMIEKIKGVSGEEIVPKEKSSTIYAGYTGSEWQIEGGAIHVFEELPTLDILPIYAGYDTEIWKCIIPSGTIYSKGYCDKYLRNCRGYASKKVVLLDKVG